MLGGQTKGNSQFDGDQDVASVCICMQGQKGPNKETMDSASSFVRVKAAPLVLALKLDNSLFLSIILVSLELLAQHWKSKLVHQGVSPCAGTLR